MKPPVFTFLLAFILAVTVGPCPAQEAPPTPLPKSHASKGAATVYYHSGPNLTSGRVQSYIKGDIEGDYKGEEAIRLNVDYLGTGRPPIKPNFLNLWIQFASKAVYKFKDNYPLRILVDGKLVFAEVEPEARFTKTDVFGLRIETYAIKKLPYDVFHALCVSKAVLIQVGDSKFVLPEAVLADLRDLEATMAH